jgi:cell division protein FtsB
MTRQEQIEEMAKIVDEMYNVYTTTADDIADGLYNAGYRKIDDLKAENKQLKTECALLDNELRIARQDTINVLNELKGNIKNAIDTYYNSQGGGYYLAEDVINDIDEMIAEIKK